MGPHRPRGRIQGSKLGTVSTTTRATAAAASTARSHTVPRDNRALWACSAEWNFGAGDGYRCLLEGFISRKWRSMQGFETGAAEIHTTESILYPAITVFMPSALL